MLYIENKKKNPSGSEITRLNKNKLIPSITPSVGFFSLLVVLHCKFCTLVFASHAFSYIILSLVKFPHSVHNLQGTVSLMEAGIRKEGHKA